MTDVSTPPAPSVTVVLVTAPDMPMAETLASSLVEEGLAACVNMLPGITSIYRWEGATQRDVEVLLVVKTTAERVNALRDRIVELHTFDVPEVVALPVTGGHEPYLEWVRRQSGAGGAT